MFESTAIALLNGEFVCDQTNSSAYNWLKDLGNRQSIEDYLQKIGRRLALTNNEHSFYCAWASIGSNERAEIKSVFIEVKHTVAPVVNFLSMCMNHASQDTAPMPGVIVHFDKLLLSATDNVSVSEALQLFTTMGRDFAGQDATPKSMLEKVITQMVKYGYLSEYSRSDDSYQFTGKLDYFYEVLTFLSENEKISQSKDELDHEPKQRTLS